MSNTNGERPSHVPASRVVDFNIYRPPGNARDYHSAWKALRDSDIPDVVWTPHNGGHWIVTRFDLVREVASSYEKFSSRVNVVPKANGEMLRLNPPNLDPPRHTGYRMLFNSSFSPKAVRELEARIREVAIRLIEAVRLDGKCNFIADYAERFPIEIFLSMMDLPREDASLLQDLAKNVLGNGAATESVFRASVQRLRDYLQPWIDARLGKDGTDLHSRLINGRVGGRALTREEAADLSFTTLLGGLDSVAMSHSFFMLFLASHRDRRGELVENPSLIPDAVEELFRCFPVATLAREVREDIVFGGVEMRKGDMVLWPAALANMDERVNERPYEVDFHRQTREAITFGAGVHKCPGMQLARAELRITFEEWLKRIPEFEIEPGFEIDSLGGPSASVVALPLRWDVPRTIDIQTDHRGR